MRITIKYFGLIAEVTQCEEETIQFSGHLISEVLEILHSKYTELKNKNFQVAQNQELVFLETRVTGQELALLPPFAGG
ncbi:molybdopterin synthase sulfur carrier subunit [Mariniflexile fucanivorans]|uniref:Molybdopterin synthase sulfur carrier subunit n=1 Tax=Mariniflexile fucanivorans TaxID=264023 RepID=A0A4R1RN23_9FLAO|nr:MoaD/ThiS family protein [Mariniflexile fucanivorans]TCL67701.1 molybdopterin synthase sulfur carrier subunit [Mariniflexile fucanivorans]